MVIVHWYVLGTRPLNVSSENDFDVDPPWQSLIVAAVTLSTQRGELHLDGRERDVYDRDRNRRASTG